MIVFIYDTETTGLDPAVDRIVQHGLLVLDLEHNKVVDILTILAWEKDFPVVASSGKVHGWTLPCLMKYATHPGNAVQKITAAYYQYRPVAVIAHNGIKYDRNMWRAERVRYSAEEWHATIDQECVLLRLPWLDTQHHAEYEGCPNKALLTIAAHHEFLNPFPHDAVSDCYTLVSILKRNPTLLMQMAKRAAATKSLVFANIPPGFNPANNAMVKEKGFKWQDVDGHHYDKSWIRVVERDKFVEFASTCEFQVNVIKDIPAADEYVALYQNLSEFFEKKWMS